MLFSLTVLSSFPSSVAPVASTFFPVLPFFLTARFPITLAVTPLVAVITLPPPLAFASVFAPVALALSAFATEVGYVPIKGHAQAT